jgi:hypothetical protein
MRPVARCQAIMKEAANWRAHALAPIDRYLTASKFRTHRRGFPESGWALSRRPLEREISVDCMRCKDGDAKHT